MLPMEAIQKITEWHALKAQIEQTCKPLVEQEMKLRKEIFALAFPSPTEGTNNGELPDGWVLKGVYKLDRSIDESALPAVKEELRKINVNPDLLVKYKPELVTKIYKALPEQARLIFDNAMTTKPASPTLELVAPKEKK